MTSRAAFLVLGCVASCATAAGAPTSEPTGLDIGGGHIEIELRSGRLDASRDELMGWISTAASAVATYYGRFPVARYRLVIQPVAGKAGVLSGTTWPGGGARTRVLVGEHTSAAQLARDWIMTHEMLHTAFPDQPDAHHWIEEGISTYVEPLARSWVGNYPADKVWTDLVEWLPRGLPGDDDRGLDHTHTWGRTYWGGALFCFLADVEIRDRTHGRRGLVDALRGIVAAGGNDQSDWPIDRAFREGDKAIGAPVLQDLYRKMKDAPFTPDLDAMWRDLGVVQRRGTFVIDDQAPKAALRRAIAARPPAPASSQTENRGSSRTSH